MWHIYTVVVILFSLIFTFEVRNNIIKMIFIWERKTGEKNILFFSL